MRFRSRRVTVSAAATTTAALLATFVALPASATQTAVDRSAWATGAASTPFNSGSTAATSTANELVFGLVGAEGGASPVFGGGYTALPILAVSTDRLAPAYQIVTSTGSFTAAGSATGQWMAEVLTVS